MEMGGWGWGGSLPVSGNSKYKDQGRVTLRLSQEASAEEVEAEVGAEAERSGALRTLARAWACTLGETGAMEVLTRGGTGPDFGFHRIPLPAAQKMDSGGQSRSGEPSEEGTTVVWVGWRWCLGWGGNSGGSRSGQIRVCFES